MPLRITMLAYPAFLVVMALGAKGGGGTSRLMEAKAFSPDTARRPESVGIKGGRETLDKAVRSGIVVDNADGRFYVDLVAYKRRQQRMLTIFGAVAIAGAAVVVMLWAPWKQ